MSKKPLVAALVCTGIAAATLATPAAAADPVLGALLGGGVGAAIGSSINGHHGAAAGAAIGAIAGAGIAASANNPYYYGDGYYAPPPVYSYAPAPVYAPVYAAPTVVVGVGRPYYGYRHVYHGHRYHRGHWH
jgi:hypothetical protein